MEGGYLSDCNGLLDNRNVKDGNEKDDFCLQLKENKNKKQRKKLSKNDKNTLGNSKLALSSCSKKWSTPQNKFSTKPIFGRKLLVQN